MMFRLMVQPVSTRGWTTPEHGQQTRQGVRHGSKLTGRPDLQEGDSQPTLSTYFRPFMAAPLRPAPQWPHAAACRSSRRTSTGFHWENEPEHWQVTGTSAPYSRAALDALCRASRTSTRPDNLRGSSKTMGRSWARWTSTTSMPATCGPASASSSSPTPAAEASPAGVGHRPPPCRTRLPAALGARRSTRRPPGQPCPLRRCRVRPCWTVCGLDTHPDGWKDLILFQRMLSTP